jgi:methionyl-tRNA formyltransferase
LTATSPWRVAIISVLPMVVQAYARMIRAAGHEPVVAITPRRRAAGFPPMPFAAEHVADDPEQMDILFAAGRKSLARMLRAYEPDLALCTGFPWLIPADAIDVPRLGIVNGHPSLLPRYRGPFPIAWAVRNGETEIGLSYHLMDAEFDTGNLLAQAPVPIADDDTEPTLFARVAETAAELLPIVFERLARGERGDPQEGGDYQSMFEDAYWTIDPARPAADVHRQVRAWAFMPPIEGFGPFLERDGARVKVKRTSLTETAGADRLECADGPLWIVDSVPA